MKGSGKDTASNILLGLALVGSVVMLFFRPFGVAPVAFLAALIGSSFGSNRRFGLATTMVVTLCFLIGTSIAIWNSRSLY
ncbi:MAG TPA: hypothetical protein VGM80_06025 [Gaiellaceae bacterium]|jgi:uncharacterized oligopeptide transporter (OPT) family protein